jgi:TolC family type I secretion outer membrane protein
MLLNVGHVKKLTKKKRIETMSSQHSNLPLNLRLMVLGLALSASPVFLSSTLAEAKSDNQPKPIKIESNGCGVEEVIPVGPINKVAAARMPEARATVHNLESALESAYRNNSELKELQAAVRSRDEGVPQALAGWRPTVYANANVGGEKDILSGSQKNGEFGMSPQSGQNVSTASADVTLNQNLYNGGKTVAMTCKSESLVQAARSQLADKEREIFMAAVQAYFGVIARTAELEYRRSNENSLKATLEATKAKFNVGEETRTAIAQAEAQLAQGVAERQSSEAQLEAAKATFEQVTGAHAGNLKKPGEPSALPKGLKEALEIAKKNNPAILAAIHQEKADRSAIKESDADLLPKIDLTGKVARSNKNANTNTNPQPTGWMRTSDFTTAQSVGVSLRVPIYEQGAIRGKSRELRETAEQRRIQIETARRKVIQQLVEAWETYLSAKANVASYKTQVKSNEVSLEGTRQEMLVGSKILLDVLNAQRELVSSQLRLVQAEQTYYQNAFNVLAIMGRLNAMDMNLKVKKYDPKVHYHDVRNSW